MATFVPKRRERGAWITDWRRVGEHCLHAVVVIGWFAFVVAMLAMALERAP